MFNQFAHRQTDCAIEGVAEKVILSRMGRGRSVIEQQYVYNGLFAPTSTVATGAKVTSGADKYLVESLRNTFDTDKYTVMIKTNVQVTVQRYGQTYDTNDNPIGDPTFSDVVTAVDGFAEFVNSSLRQKEEGLLPTTVYTLLLQTSVDVRPPQDDTLEAPDRIVMNGLPYQVDHIDKVRYPNLLFIQLSEDKR